MSDPLDQDGSQFFSASEAVSPDGYDLMVWEVADIQRFFGRGLEFPWWKYIYEPHDPHVPPEAITEGHPDVMWIKQGKWAAVRPTTATTAKDKYDNPTFGWDDPLWE